jgi:type IV pilus assembly protein PilW
VNAPASSARERGVGLVEMMVALVVGLLVCSAVMVVLNESAAAGRRAIGEAQLVENATAALQTLREHLSLAGFALPIAQGTDGRLRTAVPARAVFGCDGGFADTRASAASLVCAANDGPDAIAIVHEANAANALMSAAGTPLDCLGNAIAAAPSSAASAAAVVYVADSRLFIGRVGGSGRRELYCRGAGASAPQPLVEGIEDLQFEYGVRSASGLIWREAAELAAADWTSVAAVRICVVAASADEVAPQRIEFDDCSGERRRAADRRLYRSFVSTVALPQRVDG